MAQVASSQPLYLSLSLSLSAGPKVNNQISYCVMWMQNINIYFL
jgi:hypothetical protein